MDDYALVLNAGSSSLKFCVYRRPDGAALAARGARPDRGHRHGAAVVREGRRRREARRRDARRGGARRPRRARRARRLAALAATAARACSASATASSTAAPRFAGPTVVTPRGPRRAARARCRWRRCTSRYNLAAIEARRRAAARRAAGRLLRHELPPRPAGGRRARAAAARRSATAGVQRYGFHGLSYEYIASVLPEVAPEIAGGRVIVAHLGSGASLCALQERQERRQHARLHRARRALHGHAARRARSRRRPLSLPDLGLSAKEVETMLYKKSGPARHLRHQQRHARPARRAASRGARLAVDYFVYRAAKEIGALAAVLGGVDGLVFTAGIGENSAEIRRRICEASRVARHRARRGGERGAGARGSPRPAAASRRG